jgi:hypothetical protein
VGDFSATYQVQRFITPPSGSPAGIDCAAPDANCVIGASDFFSVERGVVTVPITFLPQEPVTNFAITGSVTGPDGGPLPGATVWAYTPSDSWVASLQAVTNTSGSYDLSAAQPGVQYRIRFGRPAGTTLVSEWFNDQISRQNANVVTLTLGTPTFVADAQLFEGDSIAGSVTNAVGAPLSGVAVWAYGPWDRYVGTFAATTAADGSYVIEGVLPEQYRIRFIPPSGSGLAVEWFDNSATRSGAQIISVSPGQAVTGIDAVLESSP